MRLLTIHYIYLLVVHLFGIFLEMSRACAIDSPVAFLTANHVIQIGFDQISPSAHPPARSGNEIKLLLLVRELMYVGIASTVQLFQVQLHWSRRVLLLPKGHLLRIRFRQSADWLSLVL